MDNLTFKVKVIWLWTKLSGENKYFSVQAKSSEDVCCQNKIIIKQNQILRIKFNPKSAEEIRPFKDILFDSEIELTTTPDFVLIEADGYTVKQFSAKALKCASSQA